MFRVRTLTAHCLGSACCSSEPNDMEPLKNFIGGEFVAATTNTYVNKFNPATGVQLARVPESSQSDVDSAVLTAASAFPSWRGTSVKTRVEVLFRFKAIAESRLQEITDIVVQEHGKNRAEAEAEVLKGIETVSFAAGLPDLLAGKNLEVSPGVFCQEVLRPLGVVVSIVPFNFPGMVPLWTLPIAIGCGNCLILKPSEKVPLTIMLLAEMLNEAGCPPGVFSIVHGTEAATSTLVHHPGVAAVSFVGSSRVADIVDKAARSSGKRSLCMGGAKNHLIAMPDCNEKMAIDDIMNSAFGSAGQRCMAASVLLVVGKDREGFIDRLVARAEKLEPGQKAQQIGPLIDETASSRVFRYIDECEGQGAQILLDGRRWRSRTDLVGKNWAGPTVLLHKSSKEPAMREEIFGPVLSVLAVDSLDEAIAIENSNPYGNAAAIYTSSGQTALQTSRLTAGMIGVNIGIPVPREPFSFGGIRNSKYGDSSDITGEGAINFWTEKVKITSKWTPPEIRDVITSSFIS